MRIPASIMYLVLPLTVGACGDSPLRSDEEPPQDSTVTPSGLSVVLNWNTYLGGAGFDEAREPLVLPGNRVLFSLRTESSNLPTTAGALKTNLSGHSDTYLGIISADGTALEAGTYFGGSGMERAAYGMAVTANGDIVFTSGTASRDVPTTAGAYLQQNNSPVDAGYVCRLSGSLTTIRWCTYITAWPRGGLALTPNEEVIVVGRALDGSLYTATTGAYQTTRRGKDDAFVLKLSADGSRTIFRTRLGGSGTDIGEVVLSATYFAGDIIVSGASQSLDFPVTTNAFQTQSSGPPDIFVSRLSGDGSQLKYSTLLGGSGTDGPAHPDAQMSDGSIIIAGGTRSPNLPVTLGSWSGESDLLIARFNPQGGTFPWIRVMGGAADDRVIGRVVDAAGRIIIVGETSSTNFPVSANAMQKTNAGGRDGVIVVLDAAGAVLYSTYFGGSGDDWIRGVAMSGTGTLFIVGSTTSTNLPGTTGKLQPNHRGAEDAFIARLTLSGG